MTDLPLRSAAATLVAALAASAALAADPQPQPFQAGDPAQGKVLVDRDCNACHAKRYGGDPDAIYLRPDHRVHTPQQLLAQVQTCSTQLNKAYFPEEEAHVAAYLNLRYYHFKP